MIRHILSTLILSVFFLVVGTYGQTSVDSLASKIEEVEMVDLDSVQINKLLVESNTFRF